MGSLFSGDAAKKAADATARAEASRLESEAAQQNMKANFATDLKQENIGTVIAGGTADVAAETSDLLKKKNQGTGLSSSLGLKL
jgi:hypothetical protein